MPPKAIATTYWSHVRSARVLAQPPGDERPRAADGAEREVDDARRPVEDDEADARERVHAAEREAEHDVRLEELPVDAEDGEAERLCMGVFRTCVTRSDQLPGRIDEERGESREQ